ncbi:MAG: glycosyltransferase family 39 protein [Solirubrobacterales bacterium]
MESATHPHPRSWNSSRMRDRLRAVPLPRPELAVLLVLAALLYLWGLSKNGWANDYYSAAVRSMAGSWHDFLYGSFDAKGLMTVDKPPLALWVEALSVKIFGFNSLAILVPQALMGVASVGLLYDLTRRVWGRVAGTVAGLGLALTPIVVAISRHNNPDALLILCSVGALWCFMRALEKGAEKGATKWLALAGVCVGLGFEAKMGAALMIVPGMALAWLWVAPSGRLVALRQLAVAGAALLVVALAWPVLVWLTPASSRPWISGTSDNSIWSLIWEYNGFGRLNGQSGGPGSLGTSGTFGGATGPLRLLNEALGGQAGWLLGAALAGGLGIAAMTRLRRTDPRTGWIIAMGGAFGVTAVAFSFAGGIFHPYYTSLLGPFAAALVGATAGQVLRGEREGGRDAMFGRLLGAVAIGLGAIVELVVIDNSATDLGWLVAPIVIVAVAAIAALLFADTLAARLGRRAKGASPARVRLAALACALGILLVGPAIWSVDTLGHATSSTFPAGGPESAGMGFGGGGGPGGGAPGGGGGFPGGGEGGGPPSSGGSESGSGSGGGLPGEVTEPETESSTGEGTTKTIAATSEGAVEELFGEGAESAEGSVGELFGEGGESSEGGEGFAGPGGSSGGPPSMGGGSGGMGGGGFGGESLTSVLEYTESHGGGTIAVDSQSEAASAIIEDGAEVAGIGGFSGKESSVSVEWLEERIESGAITWIYTSGLGSGGGGGGFGGDTRTGSESAIDTVVESELCTAVDYTESGSSSESAESSESSSSSATLYKCGE